MFIFYGVPDEVDQVLGDPVHVSRVVLEGGGGGERRGESRPQEVPIWAILVHHPDVVVILRPQLSVEDIGLVWRTERKLGWRPQDCVNVLNRVG